eukprot:s902_g15.t1
MGGLGALFTADPDRYPQTGTCRIVALENGMPVLKFSSDIELPVVHWCTGAPAQMHMCTKGELLARAKRKTAKAAKARGAGVGGEGASRKRPCHGNYSERRRAMEPRHPEGAEIQADGAEGAEIRPQAELRATPKGLVTLSSLLRHKGRRQLQVDDGGWAKEADVFWQLQQWNLRALLTRVEAFRSDTQAQREAQSQGCSGRCPPHEGSPPEPECPNLQELGLPPHQRQPPLSSAEAMTIFRRWYASGAMLLLSLRLKPARPQRSPLIQEIQAAVGW